MDSSEKSSPDSGPHRQSPKTRGSFSLEADAVAVEVREVRQSGWLQSPAVSSFVKWVNIHNQSHSSVELKMFSIKWGWRLCPHKNYV